ncbi:MULTISPECIES: YtxH domain-containing protein [Solibacillus]|uniref:YtxH domain-containing protein n=1 Tax=Solibacillus TaxID=648800 RepID=UPI00203B9E28|nr:YtxH domain-containing protein [Solibacillus isronensis]MCM3723049.1 YtxH domain-containing protein [Solibacillus isronensis]
MKAKSFLLGITTGIVGGAAVILFTAPQSGTALRQNLLENTKKATSKLQDVQHELNNVKQSITTLKAEVQNSMPSIVNELKDNFANFKTQIEPEAINLKQEIEKLQNSISEIEKNIPSNRNNE